MAKTGYNRKLGTSKKEQGIFTPTRPEVLKCGCLMRNKLITRRCVWHEKLAKQKAEKKSIAQTVKEKIAKHITRKKRGDKDGKK